MGSLEQWIDKKASEQDIAFQPEYWSEFESFRQQKDRRRRRRLAVLLFFTILVGLAMLYIAMPDRPEEKSNQNQVWEIYAPLNKAKPGLKREIVKADDAMGGPVYQKTTSAIEESSEEEPFTNKNAVSRQKASTIIPYGIQPKRTVVSDNLEYGERALVEQHSKADGLSSSQVLSRRNFVSTLPAVSSIVGVTSADKAKPLQTNKASSINTIVPAVARCCSPGTGLWFHLNSSVINSQISDDRPLVGLNFAVERRLALSPKWSWSASLGLGVTEGQFGIQLDHPKISYSFVKREAGFRSIPQQFYTASTKLHSRYQLGKWSIGAGLFLDRVLAVRGQIESYGEIDPDVNSIIGTQWLSKDGFREWAPGLTFDLNYRLKKTWALGVSLDAYPNGRLNDDHLSYFNHQTDSYEQHAESSWANRQSNIQFSIILSYRI